MGIKQTWQQKLHGCKAPHVKTLDKKFADIPQGAKMLISSPLEIEQAIWQIAYGEFINSKTLRQQLAKQYHADATCPVTTGIFLRIVAEAALEALNQGTPLINICPFWRVIESNSALAQKLSCGSLWVEQQIRSEQGIAPRVYIAEDNRDLGLVLSTNDIHHNTKGSR